MILTCPQCSTKYNVDASKFPTAGRTVRCAKCSHAWHQDPPPEMQAVEPDNRARPEIGVVDQPPAAATAQPEPVARASAFAPDVIEQSTDVEEAPVRRAEAAQSTPADRSTANWPRRVAVIAGWAALVLLVLLIGWSAVRYRQDVATLWPRSASLYSALGLGVNARGIAFDDVTYHNGTEDGAPVLTVTGRLVNISSRELPVPQVRIALTDKDRRELFSWTYVPNIMTLKPGQVEPFRTRLASPPDGARHLELRFVKAGE